MTSKLCPHSLRPTPDARQWVEAGCRLVKLVNDFGAAPEYLRINPNLIIIGRGYTTLTLLEQYHSGDSPEHAARKFVDEQYQRYYKRNPQVKIWEGHNEPSFGSPQDAGATAQMAWYAHYEAERLRLLDNLGLRGVVGNFSTGYPEIKNRDLRMWNAFLPALEAARRYRGLLGLHEYAGPWMWWYCGDYQLANCPGRGGRPVFPGGELGDMGWLTLRYRQVYRYLLEPRGLGRLPLVITECGTDRAGGGCPGMPAAAWHDLEGWWGGWNGSTDPIDYWRTAGRNRDTHRYYAEQLIWYDRQLQRDPYVVGATLFTFGADNPIWEPFNVAGSRVTRFLADYIREVRNEDIPIVDIDNAFPPEEDNRDDTGETGTQPDDPNRVTSPGTRGQPRQQYARVVLLMPASYTDPAWVAAAAEATWHDHRLTICGSADDAGVGNLHSRIVIALNPETWGHDPPLHAWYAQHYPGVVVASLYAQSPAELKQVLRSIRLPNPSAPPAEPPNPPVGRPRAQYNRTYVLISPNMTDPAWVTAVANATWRKGRFTIGGSADDAGMGDLDHRRVICLNPQDWGGGMRAWYADNYPGVEYNNLRPGTPAEAEEQLKQFV